MVESFNTIVQNVTLFRNLSARKQKPHGTYESYICQQQKIDLKENRVQWRKEPSSTHYDYDLIISRTQKIRNFIDIKDVTSLMFIISSGLVRNLGGITNQVLFKRARSGTKDAIRDYVSTVKEAIELVFEDESCCSYLAKRVFLRDSLQIFGQSALILFGGANYGIFHIGVIKALNEQGMLPRIICGLSTGAVIGALLCTHREVSSLTESQNFNFGTSQPKGTIRSVFGKLFRFFRYGMFMDIGVLERFIKNNIGNITFEEAYQKTGRILNIIVYSNRRNEKPFIMNYVTSPTAVIWSAAAASCAMPGLYEGVGILCKDPATGTFHEWVPSFSFSGRWIELSYGTTEELNLSRLSELFNVNHFIVSHVNPYIVVNPVFYLLHYAPNFLLRITEFVAAEIRHYMMQFYQLGILPKCIAQFQRYFATLEGHVNIYPDLEWTDLKNLMFDLSPEIVNYFIRKGEISTWKVMEEIKIRCIIERTLDNSLHQLQPNSKK